ncbi:MAG TPA: hypothetical protein VH934_04995 [Xanthobacteraceae bacterium]|jgi:hypothetical protein
MKVIAALALLVGMAVTPVYAQQKPSTVTFNGMVFDSPPSQGYQQPMGYGQPTPSKPRTYRHAKRHTAYKKSAS